jgi:hypothetical protein
MLSEHVNIEKRHMFTCSPKAALERAGIIGMDNEFAEFIERVKRANPIEDIIEETGGAEFRLKRRYGNYLRGESHDSLAVRVDEGYYVWNSTGEKGDVFTWLERRKKMDFWEALTFLAGRARLEMPRNLRPKEESAGSRAAFRVQADALQVMAEVMQGWLWTDGEALAYARGRGWSDETIREAGIGFSGRGTSAEYKAMWGTVSLYGIAEDHPAVAAVMGYRGNVGEWGARWNVEAKALGHYIQDGYLPGMMGRTRLVYVHQEAGRVVYMSGRNILGADAGSDGRTVKSFNPPAALMRRKPFYNQAYGRGAESVVIVEGQADAISLGEAGQAAMATCGTSWDDQTERFEELRKRHRDVYYAPDGDLAGEEALIGKRGKWWPLADVLGGMCRVVWAGETGMTTNVVTTKEGETATATAEEPSIPSNGNGHGRVVKDFNDWLRGMKAAEKDPDAELKRLLDCAQPMVMWCAKWAGGMQGAEGEEAAKRALEVIGGLDKVAYQRRRTELAKLLHAGSVRELDNQVKAARGEAEKAEDDAEPVSTLGGWIKGWLVEYLYDPKDERSCLAWRDPQGRIQSGEDVMIEGVKYKAEAPDRMIRDGSILMASEVGAPKSTRELVATVEAFINQVYLFDNALQGRLIAYYVLLTWIYDCFNTVPYLRAMGDYGSGKSELMKRVGHVCYRMMKTSGAGTAASLFRGLDKYGGTAFMDEMDFADGGDMANEIIKILNLGAMKDNPVWRLSEVMRADGTRGYENESYKIFGPKLIAMRKDFRDQAVASRCLTFRVNGREAIELMRGGIKLQLNLEFYERALNIRNLLMHWRLKNWQPEIPLGDELIDVMVSSRLNQVTMPLKALAQNDEALLADITRFVRSLNADLMLERGMGIDARVVEAILAIQDGASKYRSYASEREIEGFGKVKVVATKYIAKVANEMLDEMNNAEGEEEKEDQGKKKRREGITARTASTMARNLLNLAVRRMRDGYVVVCEPGRLEALRVKYGISPPQPQVSTPGGEEMPAAKAPKQLEM